MVANVCPETYKKLAYMRLFLKKQKRRTGFNSNLNIYQVKREKISFSNLPHKAFYCLTGIHVPPLFLKTAQGLYFATQG